ncbi:unnamed protein product [Mytilus edulis]|uniref:Uncharacterized protein n=1 Tax=Mytilus edulis TaxID=6550 RepID=A0A8S3U0V3_MYTED|nr:unnamed protein product [Mytilus edulis]
MAKERLIKDPPNPTDDLAFQRIRQEESLDQNAESSGTNETVVDLTQATNKSVQMEASHDNLQKDNERLNGIVEDVNRRVQQSEAENKGLNEQVVTLNKHIIHLEEENKNLTADIERIRVDFTRMKEQNEKLLEEKGYLKAEKTALEKHCSMLKEKEEEYKNQHTNEDLNLNGKERETRKRCIKKPPMVDFMCEPAKKKACSSKQHSQESVLPFPLPTTSVEAPPPVENTIEGKSNDCHIVDWNGKVFLSLKTYEKSYIFCKRQIGHMTGDQFIFNENKDSYVLNRKDIQGDQEGFIICCVKCNVDDNKICLLKPASTLKDRILNYMKDEGPKDEGPKDGGSKDEGPKDEGSTENNKHDKADDTSK